MKYYLNTESQRVFAANDWGEVYRWDKGDWVESTYSVPQLEGFGGAVEFDEIEEADAFKLISSEGEQATVTADVEVAKSDSYDNLVFGWASVTMDGGVPLEDRQGDIIDIEDLERAVYEYNELDWRPTGDMHMSEPFGKLVESMVITQDKIDKAGFPQDKLGWWWVGFRVPPEYHEQVRNGKRTMFSIEGTARREPV